MLRRGLGRLARWVLLLMRNLDAWALALAFEESFHVRW